MNKYYVIMRLDARFTACVEAESLEEAKKKANEVFVDADFGMAEDIDADTVAIQDEDGNFIYEK